MVNTSTKLGRSPVTQVMDTVDATSDSSSAEFYCQRYGDEEGSLQTVFNQDPVGTGEIVVEGRMAPGLPWGVIADSSTHGALNIAGFSPTELTRIAAQITVLPIMRVSLSGVAAIAGGTTVDIYFQE